MLSIRLRRMGSSRNPHFRVVVADRAAARDGAFLEILGHYHPQQEPAEIDLDVERTRYWIDQGASVSDTVKSLLKQVEKRADDAVGDVQSAEPEAKEAQAPDEAEETEAPEQEESEVTAEAEEAEEPDN